MNFTGTHLSDDLFVNFSDILTTDDIGTTLQYTISHNDDSIYNGQIYILDNTNCRVYINDIVEQLIDYKWFRDKDFNTVNNIVKTITVTAKEQSASHTITLAHLVPNKKYNPDAADYYSKYSDNIYPKVPSSFNVTNAVTDEHSEFYIAWINRYGQFQCQPFCKKWEMKEKVTTANTVTLTDETVPYRKTTEFSWTLNSDWLTYAEHDEYESLLISKYVYLFNSQSNEGYFVNVTDANWIFKNTTNTKKPFNLTVNVTKSQKQNITL